jgi:uncharacterized repeat protein (TIGR01451 family)
MRTKQIAIILAVLLLLGGGALAMSSMNYAVAWFVPLTGGGGGPITSTHYAANFTVGQVAVGLTSSANYATGLGYWYGVEAVPLSGANLSVSKIATPNPVATGGTLTYTVTVRNNGPEDASGVTLVDVLPSDVTLDSASPSQGSGCVGTSPMVCSLGDLVNGASATVVIVVTAPGTAGTINNATTATSSQVDPNTSDNTANASTTVSVPTSDLVIAKSDVPDPVATGSTLTYTLVVTNTGPFAATGVSLTDELPPTVTFGSASAGCGEAVGVVTCTLGDMGNGTSRAVTIAVTAPSAPGTITNTAMVGLDQTDPYTGNNTIAENTSVVAADAADLMVAKFDAHDPVIAGDSLTYTVVITNHGPATAVNVTLSDTLPSEVGLSAPVAGCVGTDVLVCGLGSLARGESVSITIPVTTPVQATTLLNTAHVTSLQDDYDPDNDTTTEETVLILPGADLAVTKGDEPDPVIVGGALTYTVVVVNDGPYDATGVQLVDTLPPTVTYVLATPDQGTCSEALNMVACDLDNISNGASVTVTIVVTAPSTVETLDNTVNVGANESDPDPGDNVVTEDTTVIEAGMLDLAVTKGDFPDPVDPGDTITYTIDVVNNGPSAASGVVLTDTLPAGAAFSAASPACGETAGVVTCTLGNLAHGASRLITVVVTAPMTAGIVNNDVTVASDQTDYKPANNTDTEPTTVSVPASSADLVVNKLASAALVAPGDLLTYTINLFNNGPGDATGARLTDTLPVSVTFLSVASSTSCNESALTVVCDVGDLASSTDTMITIVVTAPITEGTLSNEATAIANEVDSNVGNNTDTAFTTVSPLADLSVTKADTPDPVAASTSLTYTLIVANNGPTDTTGVVLTDTLPPEVTLGAATASQGGCSGTAPVVCELGDLASGTSVTVTIVVTAPATAKTLDNTADVTGDHADPNLGNNAATASTQVVTGTLVDLSVTKADAPDPVATGGILTYTLIVANHGPTDTTGVVLTDTLPPEVTLGAATASQGGCGGTAPVVCELGDLANAASVTVTIVVTAPATAETLDNTVRVAGDHFDSYPDNNTASTSTQVIAEDVIADLSITKIDTPDPVAARGALTYTITVTNNGPANATGVVLTDTLPPEVTLGAATPSQGRCSGTNPVICTLGDLSNGANAAVVITVTAPITTATFSNTVRVTSAQVDLDTSNNTATASTQVTTTAEVDLSVTKAGAPDPVAAGGTLTYTIVVTNNGPDNAPSVMLTDTLPIEVALGAVTPSQGSCSGTATVVCTLGDLNNGAGATITIMVTAPGTAVTLNNTAAVGSDLADSNPDDNTTTISTTVAVGPRIFLPIILKD